jgi:TRAP transporter TAXI family solute receptor
MQRITGLMALAAGIAFSSIAAAQNISIATGGTGGVYYPLGGGMAAVLSKFVPGMQATAEVTGGSVANMQLIGTGKSYIALTQADAAIDALKGQDKFAGKPIPVRTIAVLYPNRMHVVSIEGTGVTKMADLKGKRVSTGSGGSATEVFAFRVIEAAGLDKDKDMRRERLGVAESVNALKDRKIDAFFWVGGLPTAAVTDLANSPGVKIRMIDIAHLVPEMAKKHGNIYVKDVIPQRMYNGMTADNQAATVTNLLAVHASMDDKTAYSIIKTLWEHRVDLVRVHAEAVNIKPENQRAANSSIPWHPAALKYFAEQGINVMGAGAAAAKVSDTGAKKADKAVKK